MPRRELLSDEQRTDLLALPADEAEFIRRYSLTSEDLNRIRRFNKPHNRLGFAVLLCYLRYPGQELGPGAQPDGRLLDWVAEQIGVSPEVWPDYIRRDENRREHLAMIGAAYGYRSFSHSDYRALAHWLLPVALQTDHGLTLVQSVLEELRERQVILPRLPVIERLCAETLTRARRRMDWMLTEPLSLSQRSALDSLLAASGTGNLSIAAWLRQPVTGSGPRHVLELIDRLERIRDLNLPSTLGAGLHQNQLLKLARIAAQTTAQHLRRFGEPQRQALLVALVLDTGATLTDQCLSLHDQIMGRLFSRAKRKHEEKLVKSAESVQEKVRLYGQIGQALVAAKHQGSDPFAAIETVVPWAAFEASVSEAQDMVGSAHPDAYARLPDWYPQIRRYAPTFLESFEFRAAPVAKDLLAAIVLLKKLNATQTREIPADAPVSFVRRRWVAFVKSEGGLNRCYYELCVLSEIRNALRSGDLWVVGSRQFKDFDGYLLPQPLYEEIRTKGLPLPVEPDGKRYLAERVARLQAELKQVNGLAERGELPDVVIKDGHLKITPLAKAVPDDADEANRRIYARMPHIRITELLLEVDRWTGFSRHFTHQKSGDPPADTALLLTAILADGLNLGLTKMAEACPDTTYARLSWLAAWHLRDEAYSRALAELVNAQHRHPLSAVWGKGTTASSDGQRFRAGGPGEPAASVNLKYGTDPSVMIYTHLSDRYAPFHSRVINANVRDATHVLDGLLYHESDIRIEEHYTDTAGFTDHVFGLCHLLGFRFAPRIRDLKDKRLHIPAKTDDYPVLSSMIGDTLNQAHLLNHWEEVLRLGTSIRQGTVTASLMLKKLGSYPRQNGLALALREVGRIERTFFMLEWMQDPELRRRVQIGLNKGEARNALARAVFFNRLGEMRDRSFENQNYRAGGLNLVVAAIILWNTVYLERAINALKKQGNPIREDLIPHISPLAWEHINLTGDYVWNLSRQVAAGQFRPLRKTEQ
ncbi:MAG: transposase [Proteobacteria bacterium]|nr:transposase [Pseudomonadota bacterium]